MLRLRQETSVPIRLGNARYSVGIWLGRDLVFKEMPRNAEKEEAMTITPAELRNLAYDVKAGHINTAAIMDALDQAADRIEELEREIESLKLQRVSDAWD